MARRRDYSSQEMIWRSVADRNLQIYDAEESGSPILRGTELSRIEYLMTRAFSGCIERERCLSVSLSVCHAPQLGFTVRRSFGAAFAKSLWPLVCDHTARLWRDVRAIIGHAMQWQRQSQTKNWRLLICSFLGRIECIKYGLLRSMMPSVGVRQFVCRAADNFCSFVRWSHLNAANCYITVPTCWVLSAK